MEKLEKFPSVQCEKKNVATIVLKVNDDSEYFKILFDILKGRDFTSAHGKALSPTEISACCVAGDVNCVLMREINIFSA